MFSELELCPLRARTTTKRDALHNYHLEHKDIMHYYSSLSFNKFID